jgi:hypothetical protein
LKTVDKGEMGGKVARDSNGRDGVKVMYTNNRNM